MKTFLFSLSLILFAAVSSFAVTIDKDFTSLTLDKEDLLVFIDRDNSKSIADVLAAAAGIFAATGQNSFPYSKASVWTKTTLTNGTDAQRTLHLINDFAAHDEVDIYLIKNGRIVREYFSGDKRRVTDEEILNRFANIHIRLDKNETLEVVTRYHSTTPISIKMKLINEKAYTRFVISDLTIWGVFIGITLALASYNLMMFFSLKNISFLFYILHSLTNLYNTLTSSGHVYAYLSPLLPETFLNLSYKVTPSLAVIFMSLFIIHFFDLKNSIRWLYKLNVANACLFAALIASLFFFYLSDTLLIHNQLSALLLPVALLIMIFSAFVIFYKGLFAGTYFLLGAGVFFTAMLTYVLSYTGLVDFSTGAIYALPLGMAAETILFSMALGQKVKNIEAERIENALLVEESNKFNSTSYLLAGILHQFKQPLIHLGAEVLKLKTERFKAKASDHNTDRILDDMEGCISGMSELVGSFYSFYARETETLTFELEAAIDKVLKVIDSSLKAYGISIDKRCRKVGIHADEKALTQTLLIILENAVTALRERRIAQPTIDISCKIDDVVEIRIKDNAGGIAAGDIDKIFNIHYSKKESKGLGIGLPLARKLAEARLNGSLSVHNDMHGACFTLAFRQLG